MMRTMTLYDNLNKLINGRRKGSGEKEEEGVTSSFCVVHILSGHGRFLLANSGRKDDILPMSTAEAIS